MYPMLGSIEAVWERDRDTVQVIYGGQCSQETGSEQDWLHNFLGPEQNEDGGSPFSNEQRKIVVKDTNI